MTDGPFLLLVREDGESVPHPFFQSTVTIGRSQDCDLTLHDRKVSRKHCRLERSDEGFVLIDEGAQNPAKVGGDPVERCDLSIGDNFTVGDCEIEIMRPSEETPGLDETQLAEGGQSTKDLAAFVAIARALNDERDLSRLLTSIVDAAIQLTGAERGFLILGQGEASTVEVARNFAREEVGSPEFKISRTIAERVRETGVPELTTNAQDDDRFSALASVTDLKLRSILCIPLRIRGVVEGVLYIDNRLQNQVFKEREKALLTSLADHAGLAIHNARTMRELRGKQADLETALSRVAQLNSALKGQVQEQQVEIADMRDQLSRANHGGKFRYDYSAIVGDSRRMNEMFAVLDKYIDADEPVLILGESGTGKELVARAVHGLGPRQKGPFISENCAALPEALLESELFGYVKGAFTGASASRKGLLVAASGGVLFLDEIGDMHPGLQTKLLRVLQEGEVRPLGGQATIKVDVRLVTATNRNLEEMVQEGDFREDLFYRLNVLPVKVPPLRERREDIPMLVERFLTDAAKDSGQARVRVSPDAMRALTAYRWRGNVRELQNEILRAAILCDGVVLESHLSETVRNPEDDPRDASSGLVPAERGTTLPELVRDLEMREINKALQQSEGNKSRAAEMLGVSRFALQRKLDKYSLQEEPENPEVQEAGES
ncbi:MAG: sigma 54-interacting transcriptional regulator [Planctomycetota bacterium]|jgi:transcriptional regulator with GAF, ATPase, and Fis domain